MKTVGIHILWPFGMYILRPFCIGILWPFVYLVAIWYIFTRFGMINDEKSGNPGAQ
jgi:hypothetical protein